MNIEAAKTIRGWMNDVELEWLASQARNATKIIEVGSFHGRSTRAMADNTDGTIFAIDTWKGSKPDKSLPAELNFDSRFQVNDSAFASFCLNLWDHIRRGKVIPLRMSGAAAAKILEEQGIRADFVFIDADHIYEEIKTDIQNFRTLVNSNGVFSGHDYRDNNWSGVTKAVDEIFPNATCPLGTNIWTTKLA